MIKETLIGKCTTKGGISNIKYDSVFHLLCSVSLNFGVTFIRLYPYKKSTAFEDLRRTLPTLARNTIYLINFSCYKFHIIQNIKTCNIYIF